MTDAVPSEAVAVISIHYDHARIAGRLVNEAGGSSAVWDRLKLRALSLECNVVSENELALPWTSTLVLLREFGSKAQQSSLGFRFKPQGEAARLIAEFAKEAAQANAAKSELPIALPPDRIQERLSAIQFTRQLRDFQLRDLSKLLAMRHGANFSVPGAGKTTVSLALFLLSRSSDRHLLVIGPKASFPAWKAVVGECMPEADAVAGEPFTVLDGSAEENQRRLRSGATRFLISYDLMVMQQPLIAAYVARQQVHVIADEAHRMKAGQNSLRGAFLLSIAPLVARRDILTGTPMPQGPQDIASQLTFLWPGQGLAARLQRGERPRDVLGNLYVRTTKGELGLRPPNRIFRDVEMLPGQLALYSIVRSEALRQLVRAVGRAGDQVDYLSARRSVMRLLQLSANPILAVRGIVEDLQSVDSGVIEQVLSEGASSKMMAVMDHARELGREGRKVVIWTIFTESIHTLENQLADLNPVTLHGQVKSGDEDVPEVREGRLKRFHEDESCKVLIANPAAAGEGISLHRVCHDAIYLDRSYVSTHYLQSIDRIHRLGLPEGVETNIFIYRTRAPAQLGSIDYSVSRRLAKKIRGLQQLLDDTDLHQLALDEEESAEPVDYGIDLQDLVDLVAELEGKAALSAEAN